ncbi:hypothetical protein [Gordonia westfalica]|uniref:Uncharacterized protein n=1 Tax=Gordonia westfalica TaxID=158898 RepID=A0A1H2E6M8_9ACTN|nr:hypothetical protein [Gordonia westfalica]SDT84313.1 hypothetical protein SAMN04488548_10811 [Gordonia westfalica]SDT84373.1 hypothetical protein SAMN04488548_10830 [Gordonia westfalica]SDT84409.1 hypothetical protein SAMN04488548_10842 [Gordonia westfalica]SDT87102.1 hypothetical protein SAMN04488548_12421 [Gordonia westfalica]SDT87683.1 hypothetical protein SAMN04488548_12518 [Gordonia westfalica]
MTVAELIAKLQQMPQDATACIDWAQMGVWSEPTGGYYYGEAESVVLHDGDVYITSGEVEP